MKNELDHIITHLRECFNGKPWYGMSVMGKLGSIDWNIVNDKRYNSKSIAVLVQHIINWRIFVLKKLQGDTDYDLKIDGPNDWSEIHIKNPQEWQQLIANLQSTQEELLKILSEADAALLKKKVPGKSYTFGAVLPSISQHDIYHLGQIAMLNAMKGS